MDLTRPLWIDPEEQTYPAVEGEIAVDVAIVGGGFTGLGAAYALAESGLSVALLESRTIASGASGRNVGFVLAGPAMTYDDAVEQMGRKDARELWQFTVENNRTIAKLVEDYAIDCGYVRRGSMSLAASLDEWEKLHVIARMLHADGIESALVFQNDLPIPFDSMYLGGLYYPGNAELNAGLFLRSLARVLGRVNFYERSGVETLDKVGSSWALQAPGGRVLASTVILATNAYSRRLLPDLAVVPRRGQVLATVSLSSLVCPFPMYANYGYQYWRQTPEGRFVAGGWRDLDPDLETGDEEICHEQIHRALDSFVAQVVGPSAPVDHRWCGIMGFTPDNLPMVGQIPQHENLFIALGYSGHGVSMAFKCGQEVAKMAIGAGHAVPRQFAPGRFEAAGVPL